MIRLLKIELKKILSYRVFWFMIILFAALLSLQLILSQVFINKLVTEVAKNSPIPLPSISLFRFPQIWNNMTYIATYFNLFLAITIIFFICNEFSFKTFRQNIITGLSRKEFLLSKLYFIIVLSLATTLMVFMVSIILGLLHTSSPDIADIFGKDLQFIGGYFLQLLCYLTFAFLLSVIFKKSGLAMIILLAYTMIEQIIIWWKVPSEFISFMPMKAFARLVHVPPIPLPQINGEGIEFQDHVALADSGIAVFYAAIMIFILYLLINKKDI